MCRIISRYAAGVMALAVLCWAMAASAQLPLPPSSEFDITGVVQAATLNGSIITDPTDPLSLRLIVVDSATKSKRIPFTGGTLTVNGHKVIVPANTVVQYPANNSTWAEVFTQSPGAVASNNPQSGLAMLDTPTPATTYEVQVVGNRVIDPVTGSDQYIAAIIWFTQEGLNSGAGYINYIDYVNGEMWVGGVMGLADGARVQINDPTGKFGIPHSPDPRFTLDPENPTVRSVTGYPMGLPASAPPILDSKRPYYNRPGDGTGSLTGFLTVINMPPHLQVQPGGLDPMLEAPFEIGDYISYSGTLIKDDKYVGNPTYISAHTVIDNVAIYTAPLDNPVYVAIDVTILGTGGVLVPGLVEAATRTRFEGFTTDPSRNIYLFGIDLNPNAGKPGFGPDSLDRDWGSIDIDQGAPTGVARGRWRFRPPKLSLAPAGTGVLAMPTGGNFGYPTREVRAVSASSFDPVTKKFTNPGFSIDQATNLPMKSGNDLIFGQYHAPISEYLFPEQIPGKAIPPNNFEVFQWLAQGGQIVADGTAGPLVPWPGSALPAPPPVTSVSIGAGFNQIAAEKNAAGQPMTVTLRGWAYDPSSPNTKRNLTWAAPARPANFVQQASTLVNGVTYITATFTTTAPKGASQDWQFNLTDAASGAVSTVTVTVVKGQAVALAVPTVTQKFTNRRLLINAQSDPRSPQPASMTCTTIGALDSNGHPADATFPLTFDPVLGLWVADLISTGFNCTSVYINSSAGGGFQVDRNINITGLAPGKYVNGVWSVVIL